MSTPMTSYADEVGDDPQGSSNEGDDDGFQHTRASE
jgi:hypothetical protein